MAILSRQQYNALLVRVDIPFSACLNQDAIKKDIPGITTEAIISLMHRSDVERQKRNVGRHIRKSAVYGERYLSGQDILALSWECNFSPCWVMRLVLTHVLGITLEEASKLLKAPTSVLTHAAAQSTSVDILERLSIDIGACVHADRCSSPYVAIAQRMAGVVFERRLEEELVKAQVSFITENTMRKSGCEKTPDVLLQVPILMNGHLVNWVDSKAMFGDDLTHNENALKQYSMYVNRFGAGAVIYWFGFVADLQDACEDVLVLTTFETQNIVQIQ